MRQKATILLPGKDTGYYLRIRNRRREYIIGRKTSLLQHLTVQTADCTLPQQYAQPYPKTKLLYWSYPVSWLLTFLIHLIYLERDRRRLMTEKKEDVRAPVV